ncbi:MAG: prolyl oligopeptidase family serine peptidase [Planctomycetes bacterium]|nr:prolyl oligopeptidase family serine peptidase [Planctomycetota bacterium]
MRLRIVVSFVFAVLPPLARAQGTLADYERARSLPAQWAKLEQPFRPAWNWLGDGRELWFEDARSSAPRFVRIAADGTVRTAGSRQELDLPDRTTLAPEESVRPSRASTVPSTITFVNRFEQPVRLFWVDGRGESRPYGEIAPGAQREQNTYVGHTWLADFAADDLAGVFVADGQHGLAVVDVASRQAARPVREPGPRRLGELSIRDHDVWLRVGSPAEEYRLSSTGRASDPFALPRHWSPDGTKVLGFQVEPGERRTVHLVESSPRDQLQPKLHEIAYRKPGDRIDRPRPRLFDLAARRQVPIDDAPFAAAWSLDHVHWADDGREVYCLYNQRGHQVLRVLAIDAATGAVRTVLEERSATFVDWSQKTFLHWLDGGRAFLWASERDGWNHLYHVTTATGAVRQVTKGPWLVREVDHVDATARTVTFAAMGIVPGQDPYHVHLVHASFDGGAPTVLTAANGTHEWTWGPGRHLVVVRWSRVDQPWVTELRRCADGALLAELGRDDATRLLAAGFRPPQRFAAKGRDGTTDVHGVLVVPSTFEAGRRYPVVEDVYAGPQDHFAPVAWGLGPRQRELAELGFVVVQIDGMGTNWRHKAFHDVCWRNLKDGGLPDRIAWLRAAAATRPFLDLERVGIFGGSAGGQTALAAMLHHGDFYRCAVADCGCHDNRMDKIWWNEAWMGFPVGPWYADSSNVTHAAKLRGPLLLTVGELDRNVDPASTMQVVRALIDADKDFDLVVVPGGGHGVGETSHLVRRRQDFFVRNLLRKEPRRP